VRSLYHFSDRLAALRRNLRMYGNIQAWNIDIHHHRRRNARSFSLFGDPSMIMMRDTVLLSKERLPCCAFSMLLLPDYLIYRR
jgi:hypothetical protein